MTTRHRTRRRDNPSQPPADNAILAARCRALALKSPAGTLENRAYRASAVALSRTTTIPAARQMLKDACLFEVGNAADRLITALGESAAHERKRS